MKNAYLGIKKEEGKKVIELFEKHNTDIKKLAGIDYSPVTIKRYETSIRHTQNYILYKYGKYDMFLTELDLEFITGYEMYLKTVRKCNHNSTMKYLRNFKKIVRIALINGWLQKDPFVNYKIRLKKVDRGFLSDEELQILINKDFSVNRLSEIRDCFVFSCFTGLAHSDLKRLTRNNLVKGTDGDNWIKINRKKTDNLSSIPVLTMTQQIIDKYENNPYCIVNDVLLPVRSNQKMNAYLKEIANICEIKQDLTTHLARHTFATTVTLNNDVPMETVSKMLGHSSMATTKIYARLLDKKVGNDMSKLNSIYTT
ncbi:site-specific integrase [Bacteroidota bacterium]